MFPIVIGLLAIASIVVALRLILARKSLSDQEATWLWRALVVLSPLLVVEGLVVAVLGLGLYLAVLPILTGILVFLMVRDRKLIFTTGIRNLLQAKRRTLLLGSALGFVTLLLVLMLALLQGITDNMVRAATTLAAGHVNVGAWFKQSPGDAVPVVLDAPTIKKIAEENTPGADYVIDRQRGFGKIVSDNGSVMAGFTGIDPKEETHLTKSLTLARLNTYNPKAKPDDESRPGDLSRVGEPGTITIFASQAKKLNVVVGDALTITTQSLRGAVNSAQVTIVAICEDIGLITSFSSFVNKATIQSLYALDPNATGVVMVYLKDITKSDEVMAHLRQVFTDKGYLLMEHDSNPFWQKFQTVLQEDWTGQKLDLTTWEDEVSFLAKTVWGLKFVGSIMMFILLFVIVIGIINTMWIAVRERTSEVGTLRAVGMTRLRVLVMFLTEAVLLGLAATIVGSLLAGVVGGVVNHINPRLPYDAFRMILMADTVHFTFRPSQFLIAIITFTVVTASAALWPSSRAARMQPVTAIQQVE